MISDQLLSLVRCPDCASRLRPSGATADMPLRAATTAASATGKPLVCDGCAREFPSTTTDFLDLRPLEAFNEQTKYLDEALHTDARHERLSPPLLGSRIRNDMLRAFLAPSPSDRVVDLGCGSGRTLLWNRDWGARLTGIDIAPFFSREARQDVDLLIGDLRRLPFADGTFTKAFSLDVLEHLSPEALRGMLAEASRVLAPGGALFVYTHVRKNSRIALGLRGINKLARALDRVGLVDLRQEHLRKSDHLNPLKDIPELEQVAKDAGFRIERIRYYTPIVGGFVENILVRMAERAMARRAAKRITAARGAGLPAEAGSHGHDPAEAGSHGDDSDVHAQSVREARTAAKQQIAKSPLTYAALRGLSFAMKLDLLLFGRVRSGPFFALLVKQP